MFRKALFKIYKTHKVITPKLIKKLFNKLHSLHYGFGIYNVEFYYNKRLKKSAGMLKVYSDNSYDVTISKHIFDSMPNKIHLYCNGILCKTKMKCLIVVLEHEFVHYILSKSNIQSDHDKQFKKMAYNLFGHTEFTHDLL